MLKSKSLRLTDYRSDSYAKGKKAAANEKKGPADKKGREAEGQAQG